MDLTPRAYATFDDLYGYCYRVASAVGLCCLQIWGYASDGGRAEAMAEACGMALQLTNILRDVGEDARNGRIYLPQDELAPVRRVARRTDGRGAFAGVAGAACGSQAKRAYSYYETAAPLSRLVAPIGRPVLGAIAGIYRALLTRSSAATTTCCRVASGFPAGGRRRSRWRALPSRFAGEGR